MQCVVVTWDAGLATYRVVKGTAGKGKGEFSYAICDQEGNMMKVNLHGAGGKKDPLTGIRNAEFKLSADNSEILVVNVDGDCVVKK